MKKQAILKIVLVLIILTLGILSNSVYAENEVNNVENKITTNEVVENTTNQEEPKPSENTSSKAKTKSSNADLSDLGIKPNDFKGFKPSKTSYTVTVPEKVEKVEIYAILKDENARLTGTGTKTLKMGENNFSVVVTAEDGTKKTYKLAITRGEKDNSEEEQNEEEPKTNQEQNEINGLESLKIGELKLTPEFSTDVYEYKTEYVGAEKELDIQAIATDKDYIVEITGNKDLKEGENVVTILVSKSNGDNVATYQITIEKKLKAEEEIVTDEKQNINKWFIIGVAITIIVVIIVIIVIVKVRNDRVWAQEYALPYAKLTPEEENDFKELFDSKQTENNEENNYEEEHREKRKKHKGKRYK